MEATLWQEKDSTGSESGSRQNNRGMDPWAPRRKLTFDQVLSMLEPKTDGVFYRHPFQVGYNNPYDKDLGTSRDQLVPIIAAMGVSGKTDAIERLWNALPEDVQGKHAFNGEWRDVSGLPGKDCGDVEDVTVKKLRLHVQRRR